MDYVYIWIDMLCQHTRLAHYICKGNLSLYSYQRVSILIHTHNYL